MNGTIRWTVPSDVRIANTKKQIWTNEIQPSILNHNGHIQNHKLWTERVVGTSALEASNNLMSSNLPLSLPLALQPKRSTSKKRNRNAMYIEGWVAELSWEIVLCGECMRCVCLVRSQKKQVCCCSFPFVDEISSCSLWVWWQREKEKREGRGDNKERERERAERRKRREIRQEQEKRATYKENESISKKQRKEGRKKRSSKKESNSRRRKRHKQDSE